jgi:hypothetical protein
MPEAANDTVAAKSRLTSTDGWRYFAVCRSEDGMKIALITFGLLATTGALYAASAYAACPFCP